LINGKREINCGCRVQGMFERGRAVELLILQRLVWEKMLERSWDRWYDE
jgi:hypothetical protein